MEIKFDDIATMTKVQLRAACRSVKLRGYGNMTVAQMRSKLWARERFTDNPFADSEKPNVDVPPSTPAPVAKKSTTKPAAKKPAPKAKGSPKKGSVKSWLVAQFGKGELTVAAAIAHAAATGRSKVTIYRQSQELGMRVDTKRGVFVKR